MPLILLAATIPQAQVQAPGVSPAWTPESVLITIGFGLISVLVVVVGWMAKRQLDDITKKIEMFAGRQSELREKLPITYADKVSTSAEIKELYIRTDRHEKILERHSVMLGGRRAGDRDEE
ncbi:hypothetical protein [Desulfobacter sp.]|uniref:hypothetical protein n=1 Tax=Desulfobacter sp. TaxID=2294 RepID=UPI003D095979